MRPTVLDSTRRYYDEHAEEFCADTFSLDMSELYRPFVERLPKGGRVLDAGCGSGRDTLAFQRMGFQVEAFDASEEMVRVARELTALDIRLDSFSSFSHDVPFNGIWACASLLHLTEADLVPSLIRLREALVLGGVMYVSFKYGEGRRLCGDRTFLDLTPESIASLAAEVPGLNVERVWETKDLRPQRGTEGWVNALLSSSRVV